MYTKVKTDKQTAYKVGCIHDAILNRVCTVQSELQYLFLFLATFAGHGLSPLWGKISMKREKK